MYDKVIIKKCSTCGATFQSDIIFEKGKLHCYVDCPKCRKNKSRYLSSVDIYSEIYTDNS